MKIKQNHFVNLRATSEIIRKDGKKYTIRKNRQRFFYPDEWMAFHDKLKPKQKIVFEILINTGARISEAKNIKVSDIDFERKNIVLRVTKKMLNRPGIKKTERKIRVIHISDKFAKFLRKVINKKKLSQDDYFPIPTIAAANIAMKKALQRAGIKDWDMFSLHNVRKTFETWLIALGIDNTKIIKHLGHSQAIALKHYISADTFNWDDKKQMREIIGDLYQV